jgi:hypothetical protein
MKKQPEVGGGRQRPTLWERAFSAAGVAANKCRVNFKERQNRNLVWMTLVAFALIESYFVRELLVAFFFFTVFYACLAVLVVLFVLVVDALDRGSVWLGTQGRTFPSLVRHYLASSAYMVSLPKHRVVHRIQKLKAGANPDR